MQIANERPDVLAAPQHLATRGYTGGQRANFRTGCKAYRANVQHRAADAAL